MKVLFYGTPGVAVPFLEDLARDHSVVGVVTRADKPAGRGLALEAPPVKTKALALGLPVLQPVRSAEIAAEIASLSPDLAVAVAYGRILDKATLAVPRLGTLNVHFSLLPKYRGAAPVQWSLVRGETVTGVTVFWLDEGLDTGPVASSRSVPVGPEEDAAALFEKLAALGRTLLAETLAEAAAGRSRREPQVGEPSLAPVIKRSDARVSLDTPAPTVHNLVRGMSLGPRAFLDLVLGGRPVRLTLCKTSLEVPPAAPGDPGRPADVSPGTTGRGEAPVGAIVGIERGKGFLVQCGQGSRLWVLSVQPEGKRQMPAADFLNGARLKIGDVLSVRGAA
ncbi:MAG: methionyl-tRNA formyltransferase [Elusimicrobia bacterium]|nr:methionyl-tRNA formyltransferase [Elusimicrobiota bacterium]